ncbi:MAG: rhomboid family protein [Candidatus Magnetoglobus multicellularis str. Araruama]|uniref:Rhomboid family protein n=1 Tax=Candidatus Magnetoglobus multicellularis str. Araruama TaxID=890399 RepID=A0A1V1P402_9BACT|nr:MAG: rhomboid family protein [Candidatus Magnetoglobus multicellularis str. Araruama]
MFPIRDTIQSQCFPIVNYALIGINIFFFGLQLSYGPMEEGLIYLYGLLPVRYSMPELSMHFSIGQQLFSLISFMFLHGGFWHLLTNMWTLYIFGDNVEDHFGSIRYLLFYLLCGMASGLAHLLTNFYSPTPTIGASGAIAGVMGAYFILHPGAKILTLIPIIIIPYFLEIPAFVYLGIWFVLQVVSAAGSSSEFGGIAWWAHIGGFISGIVLLRIISNMPVSEISKQIKNKTTRRHTPYLQVIRPIGPGQDEHLYADIHITPYESNYGARKTVNIPWGFHDQLFRVSIPPGMRDGSFIRLKGQGKRMPSGLRGDLFLKVQIQ